MRRVMTALVFAGAIALAAPCALFAQHGGGHAGGFSGGHGGGFSGGHTGGFSGGGFAGHSFTAPNGGFAAGGSGPRSFPPPRMNFMPGSGPGLGSGAAGYARFAPAARPYGGFNGGGSGPRSPFGQLSVPAVRRAPYPGASNKGWTNQPNHSGDRDGHGRDHDGHNHYRSSYYRSTNVYSWPYYLGSYWPWWPYFGNWDSGYDNSADTTAAPSQAPDQYPDQYYAPDPPEESGRPGYQPANAGSPGAAISEPAVTIVFKDGHSQQIRNFALTPHMLLEMDSAPAGVTYGVPLDLINLPATEQANRAAGVDFRLPISY